MNVHHNFSKQITTIFPNLTGSNVVDETQIRHSGTGRISRLQMGTMSLWESQESNGSISLKELFDNPQMDFDVLSTLSVDDLIFAACRGGWPAAVCAKIRLLIFNHEVFDTDASGICMRCASTSGQKP